MANDMLDQTQDLSGTEWHRLTSTCTVPAFVKAASHSQRHGDPAELPATVYGYPQQRLYPCHTAAATWASAVFFQEKQANWPVATGKVIWERIKQAAVYWGISPQLDTLLAEREKNAAEIQLADGDYALVWGEGADKQRHYPLRNGTEVKAAAAWLEKFRDDFTLEDRQQIADKVLVKAAEFNVISDNQEYLCRTAGHGYCTQSQLVEAWEKRAILVRRTYPDHAERALAMAKAVGEAPLDFCDHGTRVKLANLLDNFDAATKLHPLYGDGGLERPEDTLFQITEKVASDTAQQYVATTTGTVYEKAALAQIPLEEIRDWLGNDIAAEVSALPLCEKLAAVISTLPRPDAQAFDHLAEALGIPVFARNKAAAAGYTESQLRELAAG